MVFALVGFNKRILSMAARSRRPRFREPKDVRCGSAPLRVYLLAVFGHSNFLNNMTFSGVQLISFPFYFSLLPSGQGVLLTTLKKLSKIYLFFDCIFSNTLLPHFQQGSIGSRDIAR